MGRIQFESFRTVRSANSARSLNGSFFRNVHAKGISWFTLLLRGTGRKKRQTKVMLQQQAISVFILAVVLCGQSIDGKLTPADHRLDTSQAYARKISIYLRSQLSL